MNRETIMALTGRELDAAVAEKVMGYTVHLLQGWASFSLYVLQDSSGVRVGTSEFGLDLVWDNSPLFSTDANECRLVEIKISRQKLKAKYVQILWTLLTNSLCPLGCSAPEVFALMLAPLEIKCRAALLTVLETEKPSTGE